MTYRDTKDAFRELIGVATPQGGYFTATQARSLGYDYPHLHYHLNAGNFERVGHGVYHLLIVPLAEHDDLIRLSLWSRNERDEPQAVVSHESALAIHELGEIIPSKIHLTVPTSFRKKPPRGCVLHKAKLGDEETQEREGFKVTSPLRTILDVAATALSQEQLEKIVSDALQKGMISRKTLMAHAKSNELARRLLSVPTLRKSID